MDILDDMRNDGFQRILWWVETQDLLNLSHNFTHRFPLLKQTTWELVIDNAN